MASRPTRQRVNLQSGGFRRCISQKVGFRSRAQALDAAERMMDAGRVRPGCHITPYACDDCGEWHVANRVIVWNGATT
jgi:hypothetical protein